MAIVLSETSVEAHTKKRGDYSATLTAGQKLGLGRQNPTEVWLLETVPEGKEWDVDVIVHIVEKDA